MVKTILIASILFSSVVPGYSQTKESKLLDRIMKPNMELGNPMRDKAYSGTTAVPLKGSPVAAQGFYGVKDAAVKDFSTRSFLGLKNPWFGSKVFDTKDAPAMSIYDVKQARFNKTTDTTGYYAAKKGALFGSPVVPLSTYVPAPAAKGAVSGISDKVTEKMTIEEVRDLLNKNR